MLHCDFPTHHHPTWAEACRNDLDPISKEVLYRFEGIPAIMMIAEVSAITPDTIDLLYARYHVIASPTGLIRMAISAATAITLHPTADDDAEASIPAEAAAILSARDGGAYKLLALDRELERVTKHWWVTRFGGVTANVANATNADWVRRQVRDGLDEALYGGYRDPINRVGKSSRKKPLQQICDESITRLIQEQTPGG